ncbi:cytochrome c oxidase assembly protein [Marivita sp. GX14005]|uniref:cytochrome c oxidase assembly protein n=1 Tax=Marivita sp. GX14005 TaxID=2942276 RepID=UPI002019293E|nr:cytochrome c oxidase assembly protein [Marivita sp. GX14005]MCL3883359.1 cytochrome c oxidase assembly protein [Marivita sp. GX14005]
MPETWNTIYCGAAPLPDEIWARWNFDPVLVAALLVLAVLLRRSPSGLLGVAVLVAAFVSPLCALSSALFAARTVHHVLIIALAAPLLALAVPARRPGPAMPAFLVSTAVLWLWHWPAAYDAALSFVPLYWVMQLSLLGAFFWFWRAVLHPAGPLMPSVLTILAGWMQMALLGALLTFAPAPLYEAHLVAPMEWGLTALSDQQLGGLIMWVPAGLPFLIWAALSMRGLWRRMAGAPA